MDDIQRRMNAVNPDQAKDHELWFPNIFRNGNRFTLKFSKDDVVREVTCKLSSISISKTKWLTTEEYEIVENRYTEIVAEGIKICKDVAAYNNRDIRCYMGAYVRACKDTIFKGYELEIIVLNKDR